MKRIAVVLMLVSGCGGRQSDSEMVVGGQSDNTRAETGVAYVSHRWYCIVQDGRSFCATSRDTCLSLAREQGIRSTPMLCRSRATAVCVAAIHQGEPMNLCFVSGDECLRHRTQMQRMVDYSDVGYCRVNSSDQAENYVCLRIPGADGVGECFTDMKGCAALRSTLKQEHGVDSACVSVASAWCFQETRKNGLIGEVCAELEATCAERHRLSDKPNTECAIQ